jgi:hypothetical protein
LRRLRCAALGWRLHLTVWRRRLCGGRRRCEDKCRDDREFVHFGRLRGVGPAPIRPSEALCSSPVSAGCFRWLVTPRKMSRSLVCSATAFVGSPTVHPGPPWYRTRHRAAARSPVKDQRPVLLKPLGQPTGGRWAVISVTDEGLLACERGQTGRGATRFA